MWRKIFSFEQFYVLFQQIFLQTKRTIYFNVEKLQVPGMLSLYNSMNNFIC